VTVVGVLPTHRRRGLLRRMMEAQLRDVRERGEPIAALWASEETIYGRFGYGLASLTLNIKTERAAGGLRPDLPGREGQLRHIEHDEALRVLPRLYERVRRRSVGFLSRSDDWWETRQLGDRPEQRRGGGPLNRVLLELDGRPAGYALYRIVSEGSGGDWVKTLRVVDAVGVDDRATREIWRFLLSVDWVDHVEAWMLPVDHPLQLLVARVNLLRARVWDGLFVRLVDLGAALSSRGYAGDGRVTFDVVSDPLFPDNVGTWTVADGLARRSSRRPDVRLDVQGLAAAYLGGISFAQLARAEAVAEVARGGIARADALFRTADAPWCPENF
jgi:predicted acetyltransferase